MERSCQFQGTRLLPPSVALTLMLLAPLIGCQSEVPYFRPNLVEIQIEEDSSEPITEDQQRLINETMLAMFGTPDDPANNAFPQYFWQKI